MFILFTYFSLILHVHNCSPKRGTHSMDIFALRFRWGVVYNLSVPSSPTAFPALVQSLFATCKGQKMLSNLVLKPERINKEKSKSFCEKVKRWLADGFLSWCRKRQKIHSWACGPRNFRKRFLLSHKWWYRCKTAPLLKIKLQVIKLSAVFSLFSFLEPIFVAIFL